MRPSAGQEKILGILHLVLEHQFQTTYNIDMEDVEKVLGELLAKGLTSEEIVIELQILGPEVTKEEAIKFLTQFYKNWGNTDAAIDQPDMHRQWHVFMRHQLLQEILKAPTTKDLRTALAILDSLASIQGVDTKHPEEAEIPLSIKLVPVQIKIEVEVESEPVEPTIDTNIDNT